MDLSEQERDRLGEMKERIYRQAGVTERSAASAALLQTVVALGGSEKDVLRRFLARLQEEPTIAAEILHISMERVVVDALMEGGYRPDPDRPGYWLNPDGTPH
jgi:hypothetical protein